MTQALLSVKHSVSVPAELANRFRGKFFSKLTNKQLLLCCAEVLLMWVSDGKITAWQKLARSQMLWEFMETLRSST